jgi:hypothetical protein
VLQFESCISCYAPLRLGVSALNNDFALNNDLLDRSPSWRVNGSWDRCVYMRGRHPHPPAPSPALGQEKGRKRIGLFACNGRLMDAGGGSEIFFADETQFD